MSSAHQADNHELPIGARRQLPEFVFSCLHGLKEDRLPDTTKPAPVSRDGLAQTRLVAGARKQRESLILPVQL